MTRQRNPWRRSWLPVSEYMEGVDICWEEIKDDSAIHDNTGRVALRIRWAARQSCARLRAERDAARRELEQRTAERDALHRFAQVLEQRADEAARELRALEWMITRRPLTNQLGAYVVVTEHVAAEITRTMANRTSYAAAALALGWEGP